jgi:PIN domain nuclease of toxin-antitoxin system
VTILLDTHIWLWMLADPDRLGALRDPLEDEATTLLLSAASSWEIAIEHAHAVTAGSLPRHHRDPFDRLLLAQATRMDVPIATADRALDPYGVPLLRP